MAAVLWIALFWEGNKYEVAKPNTSFVWVEGLKNSPRIQQANKNFEISLRIKLNSKFPIEFESLQRDCKYFLDSVNCHILPRFQVSG